MVKGKFQRWRAETAREDVLGRREDFCRGDRQGVGLAGVPRFGQCGDRHRRDIHHRDKAGSGIFGVYPQRSHLPLKVRAIIDYLVDNRAALGISG